MKKTVSFRQKAAFTVVFCLALCGVGAWLFIGSLAPVKGGSDSQRRAYLLSLGYEAGECETAAVQLPASFSGFYEKYAQAQREQGFPLQDYAGQKAFLYCYEVVNLSYKEGKFYANLLICDDFIIAGDIFPDSSPKDFQNLGFFSENNAIF